MDWAGICGGRGQGRSTHTGKEGHTGNTRVNDGEDLFLDVRWTLGLWPVKPAHILTWVEGDYYPSVDDIVDLEKERALAVNEFLKCELKWVEETDFTTKWWQGQNIMWVKFKSENTAKALYRRLADLRRNTVKFLTGHMRGTNSWRYSVG